MTVNPYSPPIETPALSPTENPVLVRRVVFCNSFLLLLLIAAAGLEHYDHKTITFSGPILFAFGLILTIVSQRAHHRAGFFFGLATMSLCVLVVLLINFLGWGPSQGDFPITVIGYVFMVFFVPYSIVNILKKPSRDESSIPQ